MNDIDTFVHLKYQILTSDSASWNFLKTYPFQVQVKWLLRYVEDDRENTMTPGAKNCVETIRRWLDGKISKQEVKASGTVIIADVGLYAYILFIITRAISLDRVEYIADRIDINDLVNHSSKWNLYISWLIEELYEYENSRV